MAKHGKFTESRIGEKVFKLTIRKLIKSGKNRGLVLCTCDCGNARYVKIAELNRASTRSCGDCSILWYTRNPYKRLYTHYKSRAKHIKIEFNINFNTFYRIVNNRCYYCASLPDDKKVNYDERGSSIIKANGIDRLDSNVGYISKNCVPCCAKCNYAKRILSVYEFIELCSKITKNFSDKLNIKMGDGFFQTPDYTLEDVPMHLNYQYQEDIVLTKGELSILCQQYSNDADLGAEIRRIYNKLRQPNKEMLKETRD